jgi:putative membrane protein
MPDETRDPTRRTRLANERTYLAWWRTGLTALAVGIGAGKVAPELTGGSNWPYRVVGAGFALLGVVFMVYGGYRHGNVERALDDDGYTPVDRGVVLGLVLAGAALGLATLVLVLVR